ncbi:MAG: ParB N-terminal domain-containing protein [Chromatiaceae bacterium]|nr:ParB N-terminal domain-containing protein [Chromatiaceae bacterium]
MKQRPASNESSSLTDTDNTLVNQRIVIIDVADIKPYAYNPRRGENPEYDRIKASILAEGMDQPLVVTRRPGESDYTLYAGGNTRLRIYKELYQETGAERFLTLNCVYRPWTRETDVLLAHLRENDLRGDLSFIDKALAVRDTKRLLQQEQGPGIITQIQLADVLRERGYALSQGLISQMEYSTERLFPVLPTALNSGLGRPQVERIRQLDRAVRALWLDRSVDTEEEFDQAFSALCRRYDGPEWDIGNLRRALEAEIAERAEVNIQAVSMVLEGYLTGRRGTEAGSDWLTLEEEEALQENLDAAHESESSLAGSSSSQPGPLSSNDPETFDPDFTPEILSEPSADHPLEHSFDETIDGLSGSESPEVGIPEVTTFPKPADRKSLRARAWTLASRLAQRNGLSDLIRPLSGQGLGFLLSDVPDPALVDQLDEEKLAQLSMVWWHLAAAAEMTVAPVELLLPRLDDESILRRALDEQDAGLLFSSVWTLDPGHMGYRLWRRLDERDWRDLIDLMETYRGLHHLAKASGEPLWS